jgi:hypothetical protein
LMAAARFEGGGVDSGGATMTKSGAQTACGRG